MFIDMHMHEMTYSKDSFLTLEEIVREAKIKGLGAVCITDHDSMGLKKAAKEYTARTGFPIFTGIEYHSLDGDILAFGIDSCPIRRASAQQFVNFVKRQGGITIAAHPFRNNNRGLEEKLGSVKGLDAVEVLNGSTLPDAIERAACYARDLGLPATGASDCHFSERVGIYATYFPGDIRSMDELVRAVKNGQCMPAYYEKGRYQIWDIEERAIIV